MYTGMNAGMDSRLGQRGGLRIGLWNLVLSIYEAWVQGVLGLDCRFKEGSGLRIERSGRARTHSEF